MITSLWLKGYRNLSETTLRFETSDPVIIFGRNNQGKTNFLESLYWLGNAASPFKLPQASLVSHAQDTAFIGADILSLDARTSQESHVITSRVYHRLDKSLKKSIEINQKPVKSLDVLRQTIWTEYLSSDVIRLFQDSPEGRRAFLNRFCSVLYPDYATTLSRYEKVLKQKHRALKQGKSFQDVSLWNQQLSVLAPSIVSFRLQALSLLESELVSVLRGLFPEFIESVSFRYITHRLDWNTLDIQDYQTLFSHQLSLDFIKEGLLGYTLIGPQRDDLIVFLNSKTLNTDYSRGINRLVALLLYIASFAILSQIRGGGPVVLLDDALAEVDTFNKHQILLYLSQKTQLFYTSVLPEDKALFPRSFYYTLESGRLH